MRDAVGLRDDERQVRALARALARERIAPLAAQVDETEAYPGEQLRLLGYVRPNEVVILRREEAPAH